jgi:hypothetical protein
VDGQYQGSNLVCGVDKAFLKLLYHLETERTRGTTLPFLPVDIDSVSGLKMSGYLAMIDAQIGVKYLACESLATPVLVRPA